MKLAIFIFCLFTTSLAMAQSCNLYVKNNSGGTIMVRASTVSDDCSDYDDSAIYTILDGDTEMIGAISPASYEWVRVHITSPTWM